MPLEKPIREYKSEALIPDMQAKKELLDIILAAKPDVLNHNFETVKRLQREVRGRGNIADSSFALRYSKEQGFITKTSFMVGLGETEEELQEMIRLCAELKVDIVTFGQYLPSSLSHRSVDRWVKPEEFERLKSYTLEQGIKRCESAPLVRSSYHAEESGQTMIEAPKQA